MVDEEIKNEEKIADELDLSRQTKLVPMDKINNYFIKVFGIGSIGSHVIKLLAKTGFKNIEVYDMDTVDAENISAQAFDFKHVKMSKVDAMLDIVKESSAVDISGSHGQITEETELIPEPNTVYICLFDSFEARKIVFSKVKDYPTIFIDGRIGMHNMRHYLIECDDETQVKEYNDTLEVKAVSELQCGEKACAPINYEIAGKIVNNLISYINGDDWINKFIGNVKSPKNDIIILGKKKEKEEPEEVMIETDGHIIAGD